MATKLQCMHCGDTYVQMVYVRAWARTHEDAQSGLFVSCSLRHASLRTSTKLDGNPSARRDGAALILQCESCGEHTFVTFANHKGETFMETTSS